MIENAAGWRWGRSATLIAVVGCCVVLGALAEAAGAESSPVLTDAARAVVANEVMSGDVQPADSAALRDARVRSRVAFRDLSREEAARVLREQQPSIESRPGWLQAPSLTPLAYATPLDTNLLSVDGGAGRDSVVWTSQPVAYRDSAGALQKIDLGLQAGSGGDLVPHSSPFGLSLPATLERGISVGEGSRRFSIAPEVSNGGQAAVEDYAAFYGNVGQDTDFVAKPVLGGVETYSILRSPTSPELLRLRLSGAGDTALRAASQAAGGGYLLSSGGEDVAAISPPQAWDAQHRPVPVETSIDGNDLVLHVDHRDRDVAYPIVVDPTVVDTCWSWVAQNSGCQVDAWETDTTGTYNSGTAGWAFEGPSDGRFAPYAGPGYLGNGLYIRNLANNYFWAGEAGDWYYRAPSGVRIWSAQFANLSQDNLADNMSCLFVGVLENTGAWGTGSPRTFCAQQSLDQSWTWCPGTSCSDQSGGTPGNAAIFGAMAQHTGWSSYWMDDMGGVAIAMTEMNWASLNPYISSPDFPSSWQTSPNNVITFHIGDAGLGIRSIAFSSPENPTWQAVDADTGGAASRTYTCTGGMRLACPMDVWIRMKLGNLQEGYSTIRVKVTDMVGKTYTYEHSIAIQAGNPDAFPPNLVLSGPAVDNASQLDAGAWDLDATAVDASGVASISYAVDGSTTDTQQESGCASCTVSAESTIDTGDLGPGTHTVSVVATDNVGNQSTKTLVVHVPTTVALSSVSVTQASTLSTYVQPTACGGGPAFTPYYAGSSVAGLALTYSESTCDPAQDGVAGDHSVSYGYGSCDASAGSCGLPLTITASPLCEAHPSLYQDQTGTEIPFSSLTAKGVPEASYDDGSTVEVDAGNTAIDISSTDPSTTAAAVAAIRQVPASDVPAPGAQLTSWPAAAGTSSPTTLSQPDSSVLNASVVEC